MSLQCWQDLKDGEYVLRVGGALDSRALGHTWSFCGKTGGVQVELIFEVKGKTCVPRVGLSKDHYCAVPGEMKTTIS